MPRPVKIDRELAFREARELFWRRGYLATSLQDLLAATGMGKGSFYAAFSSKEALFKATLDWYHNTSAAALSEVADTSRGLAALRSFLEITLIDITYTKRRRGCLLVNSVIELEAVEPALHRVANRYLQDLEHECRCFLQQARTDGELRPDLQASQLAALTATLLQGLRVDSRMGASRASLRQRVDLFLSLIANTTQR